MKKFTIITPREYEPLLLREMGRAGIAQLKKVTGREFERLKRVEERVVDPHSLHERLQQLLGELEELGVQAVEAALSEEEVKRFAEDPEAVLEELAKRVRMGAEKVRELERGTWEARFRAESLKALEPEELKRCIAVGVVSLPLEEVLPTYLRRFEDLSYKVVEVSAERGYLYIFGPEERREWVEVLFQLFDVEDIFQLLGTRDVLLALSSERREEVIAQYEKEGEEYKRVIEAERRRLSELAGKVRRLHLSLPDRRVPVLRTTVVSILQGWIPEEGEERLNEIVRGLEEKTGELFFIQYEEPSEEDHPIPTPAPRLKPSFLQPAWTLTSLRGWPSAHEVNPAYITILIFSLQFGLMFGDVGQGAVFLILGLILTRKFKRGLANKLGTLFIPMGISAMIFGFLYGDVFLMHLLHPILFSPMKKIGKLMKMVLGIAVAEMCLGLSLGAINHVKEGEPIGVIGERGLGGILFLIGLYFGGLYFLKVGDVFKFFNHWSFYLMIGGLVLATLEPILVAIRHKHFGMEAIGEGIGALMMTFVESLANFFSFLRIAAFALAHAGLAIAAHSLAHFMGPGGLVLTNVIAMTFEFVSSSVQSLRLLYYEFMGKFFHGGGAPFRPYRVR